MSLTMWWPAPEALDDLSIKENEGGFTLEAPDDTECGSWLKFWSQSEEHQQFFNEQFVKTLISYIESNDGKTQNQPDQ